MKKVILFVLFIVFSFNALALADISSVSDRTISGLGFGADDGNGTWVWDNAEDSTTFENTGWSEYAPSSSLTASNNLTYSGVYKSVPMPHTNSTRYIHGSHGGPGADRNNGLNVILHKGTDDTTIDKFYACWYVYLISPFTEAEYNVPGDYDFYNYKNFAISDDDTFYGTGDGVDLAYFGINHLALYDVEGSGTWQQIYVPPDYLATTLGVAGISLTTVGFGTLGGTTSNGATDNEWNMVGVWEKWEVQGSYDSGEGEYKVWVSQFTDNEDAIDSKLLLDLTYTGQLFATRGISIGGFRGLSNSDNWVRYFDDCYITKSWKRVVACSSTNYNTSNKKEIQTTNSWSDTSIVIDEWNQGSFVDYETAYLIVKDVNGDTIGNIEGYFLDNTFYAAGEGPVATSSSISGAYSISGACSIS